MTKVNKPGSHKPEKTSTGAPGEKKANKEETQPGSQTSASSAEKKGRQVGKSNKPRIGGTALPGAKSTQPKEIKATNPVMQQAESYNRDMRRRMQHLGTGPYGEDPIAAAQEKRKKRIERRKKRVETRREEAKKSIGPGYSNRLGRNSIYFIIGVVVVLAIIIAVALILNHPFK